MFLGLDCRVLLLKEHVYVGTVPRILDLLVQWYPFLLIPAAPATESLHAREDIHAHVAAAGARPLHLELVADFSTVAHREIIDHEQRVHVVSLLDEGFLLLAEDGLLTQVGADHETVALLSESHDCLPDIDLGHAGVQDNLSNDRAQIFEVLGSRRCTPFKRLRHVIS